MAPKFDISDVPLEPVDVWYLTMLRRLRRAFGEKWADHLDAAPPDVRESFLKVHQAATAAYCERRRPKTTTQGKETSPMATKTKKTAPRTKLLRGGTAGVTPPAPAVKPLTKPAEPQRTAQERLDDVVFARGANFLTHPDADATLRAAGLTRDEVTPDRMRKADAAARNRAKAAVTPGELTWEGPFTEESTVSTWTVWRTACRTYRVVRAVSKLSGGDNQFMASNGDDRVVITGRRTLGAAMDACAAHHRTAHGKHAVRSNADAVVDRAKNLGLDVLPHVESDNRDGRMVPSAAGRSGGEPEGREAAEVSMKVSEPLARRAMQAALPDAPVTGANAWPLAKLAKRLNRLPEIESQLELPKDEGDRELLRSVIHEVKQGGKVIVVPDDSDPAPEKEEGPVTKTKTTKTKTTRNGDAVDRFGNRLGTEAAKINAALTGTPKSMAQLLAETGVAKQQYGHLGGLVKRGLVVKDKDGYALAGAAPKAKKSTKKGKKVLA